MLPAVRMRVGCMLMSEEACDAMRMVVRTRKGLSRSESAVQITQRGARAHKNEITARRRT